MIEAILNFISTCLAISIITSITIKRHLTKRSFFIILLCSIIGVFIAYLAIHLLFGVSFIEMFRFRM